MVDIMMPQLGETVTEGTVTRWSKAVGEAVAEDEVLFEVSTDKVDSEVRSPATGYLSEILVPEGDTVDVGVKLAVIAPEPPGTAPAAAPPPAAAQSDALRRPTDPWAASEGAAAGYDGAGGSSGKGDGTGLVLSPVVRRLLAEHGLDPVSVAGTGAGGRITRSDVLSAVDQRRAAQVTDSAAPPVPAPPAPAPPADVPPADVPPADVPPAPAPSGVEHYRAPQPTTPPVGAGLVRSAPPSHSAVSAGSRDEVVPFSNIRRRTAEHMVRSQATSAHTLVAMEVDFEGVEAARRNHKDRFLAEEGVKLTYLPFIARALADALTSFPHLNSSVGDDCLIVHRDLHLGIAVDLGEEGLIVPVIHEAGDKRLRALARESAELARRARTRKLGADDISGGTFTITNPGPFGTFMTVPVINQPQVAILSTDGVKRRPVVIKMPDGSEGIAIHSTGMLALSFDHRAVDGAYASRFLDRMREILQGRDWALEL